MKKLLQINVTANWGSHGKIAEDIGKLAIKNGWESWIAYGREPHGESQSELIHIGSEFSVRLHGIESRLFDNHGLASRKATQSLVQQIRQINPDIIHLHNIHGYYINYKILFRFLKEWDGKVIWTFHDCWPFTGHCSHFMGVGCNKWLTECHDCQLKNSYPSSVLFDRSTKNFNNKKAAFTSLGDNLTIVSCSDCVAGYARKSFFKDTDIRVIHNGIDLDIYKPTSIGKRKMIIGVASVWTKSKGFDDFIKLRELLPADYDIMLIGLTQAQIKKLHDGITGIQRTENRQQLIELYSQAIALVNPTYEDNFPTVNIEALACGTPVITYRTGGSPETIDSSTGIIVEQGNIKGLRDAIYKIEHDNRNFTSRQCRSRAEAHFNNDDRFKEYLSLYNQLITNQ